MTHAPGLDEAERSRALNHAVAKLALDQRDAALAALTDSRRVSEGLAGALRALTTSLRWDGFAQRWVCETSMPAGTVTNARSALAHYDATKGEQ